MDISHIVTVYSKREALPDTIASLVNQDCPGLKREYLFVDDNSRDDSVAVIEACTQGVENVAIVRNADNRGPSARLNQGAALARGKYLHFLDHDDVVPKNAIAVMHRVLTETGADFLYGRWRKTGLPARELLEIRIPDAPLRHVSDAPLAAVLEGRFIRMCAMAKRETFLAAGGADERIFIQDESLPLRLAVAAKRFAALEAEVNLVPRMDGNLSDNKSQLNHDRFLAYFGMLADFPHLPHEQRAELYARAVSAAWKQTRRDAKLPWLTPLFAHYLRSKCAPKPDAAQLQKLKAFFDALPGVRRITPPPAGGRPAGGHTV